jgi:hypothetical protein
MRTKNVRIELLVIILFLCSSVILVRAQSLQPHNADAMWVEPSPIVFTTSNASLGSKFNVTVWLNMTEDIFAYQVALHYNRTQLNCTRSRYTAGSTSNYFAGHAVTAPAPVIDTGSLGNGSVLASESLLGDDIIPGPHSESLIWMEFKILTVPASGNLTSKFDITTEYNHKPARRTWIEDPSLNDLDFTTYDGDYTFIGPTPQPLSVSISSPTTSIYLGQSVQFTATVNGGTPLYSFQWFENDSTVPGANQSTWTFTPATSALYMVFLNVTDNSGTTAESNTVALTVLPPLTGAKICVDPAEIIDSSMGPGSTFSINITVANVASLGSCVFNLTYNPQVLNWIGFDFLQAQGQYPTAIITGNTIAGFAWINLYYLTPITVISVPLTRLRFCVNSYGISPLNLTDTELLDQNGNPIVHNEFDGLFANIIRDVAVTNVVPAVNWVYQTWTDIISVTVSNLGNATESFSVSAWYNSTIIGTAPVTSLAPNTQTTVSILWDTTGVLQGNYTITGTASLVPYETYFNTTNNIYVDGIVQVLSIIHDVAITDVTPTVAWAYANSTVPINVTASNLGNVSESFTVTAYYDGNSIGTIPVASLPSGTSTILTFDWSTSGITVEGNYTLSALASTVPFEYNTANNYLEDGQLLVLTQVRDVAITNITTSSYWDTSWAYKGGSINIAVTASNTGEVTESFNVMAFYDTDLLGNVSVMSLAPNATINKTFMLNTTGLTLYHNYTISAQASIVPYEFNTTNNILVDGNVTVRIPGDANGDHTVDGRDISMITRAFGSIGPNYLYPGSPPSANWNLSCDLNGDNVVDGRDVSIAEKNYGKAA